MTALVLGEPRISAPSPRYRTRRWLLTRRSDGAPLTAGDRTHPGQRSLAIEPGTLILGADYDAGDLAKLLAAGMIEVVE